MRYTKEDKARIVKDACFYISIGNSLSYYLASENLPSRKTFYQWIEEDNTLRFSYIMAIQDREQCFLSRIKAVAKKRISKKEAIKEIESIQWELARMSGVKYNKNSTINQRIRRIKNRVLER